MMSGPETNTPPVRSKAMATMIRPSWLKCFRSLSTTLPTSPRPRPSISTVPVGTTPEMDRLYEALLTLETKEECRAFLSDLCTIKEAQEMARRLRVAQLLDAGINYLEIGRQTTVSAATISRVNRALRYGAEGYRLVLDRLPGKEAADADT